MLLKTESKRSIFLENENNTEVPNVEEERDNPLSILHNFYIHYCLEYSQTIFCLYIASYLSFVNLSKAEYCIEQHWAILHPIELICKYLSLVLLHCFLGSYCEVHHCTQKMTLAPYFAKTNQEISLLFNRIDFVKRNGSTILINKGVESGERREALIFRYFRLKLYPISSN